MDHTFENIQHSGTFQDFHDLFRYFQGLSRDMQH